MELSQVIPQNNISAEKRVLASCMHSADILHYCTAKLSKNSFYDRVNRKIWSILEEINTKGYSFDLLQVSADTSLGGQEAYLAELYSVVATVPNEDAIAPAVKRLLNKQKEREFLEASLSIISAVQSESDHSEKLQKVGDILGKIGDSVVGESGLKHIKSFIGKASKQFEEAVNGVCNGVKTGIASFDKATGGLHRGEYTIISGRPGDGKSTYAFAIALQMAKAGESVGIFTMEMQGRKVTNRMACAMSGGRVTNNHIRGVDKPPKDAFKYYQKATEDLSKMDIYLDDTPRTTNASIIASLRSFVRKNNLTTVIIDHFSLIGYEGENGGGKAYERKEEITRGIQRILKELDIIGIVLVQLGRDSQNRRPRLSDLSDTKALEQDANNVLMIWNPVQGDKERRVLCCEKARDGGTGDYYTHFMGGTCQTASMSEPDEKQYKVAFEGSSSEEPKF